MSTSTISNRAGLLASFDRHQLQAPLPHVHLLANQKMVTMLTAAGSGYVHFDDAALTRWNADRTRDADGYFIYLRDLDKGQCWSMGFQPTAVEPEQYSARMHLGSAEIERVDNGIRARMEVCLAADANVELRRCTVTNLGSRSRRIELTSYAEIVLQDAVADAGHLAFSKLFVETDFLEEQGVIIAQRRKRSCADQAMAVCHFLACDDADGPDQFETDRCRFIGRGRSLLQPIALETAAPLSGTSGSVLDPIVSLRRVVRLPPYASACVTFFLAAGGDRQSALSAAQRFREPHEIENAFSSAACFARTELAKWNLSEQQFGQFLKLAANLLYGCSGEGKYDRLAIEELKSRAVGLPGQLPVDLPLLASCINGPEDLRAAEYLLRGYAFLNRHRLACNVVLLNQSPSWRGELDRIVSCTQEASNANDAAQNAGRVKVFEHAALTKDQCDQLYRFTRVSSNGELPSCFEVLKKEQRLKETADQSDDRVVAKRSRFVNSSDNSTAETLQFANGFGGFSADGSEYVLRLRPQGAEATGFPPMPWVNVISNEHVGMIVSETGAGYSWAENSRNNRLTPWSNDPVCDPHGEALYVCDDDEGVYWSLTPGPTPLGIAYEVRHGFGYTRFSQTSHDLQQEVLKFVPRDDPILLTRIRICNTSVRKRRLRLFAYHAWELSDGIRNAAWRIETSIDESRCAVFAVNRSRGEFSSHCAFSALGLQGIEASVSYTADRTEFLGRNGNMQSPRALQVSGPLSGRAGGGLDPCAASQICVELEPEASLEYVVALGSVASKAEADALIERYQDLEEVDRSLEEVRKFWRETLSAVKVETPSPAIDLMVNGWLAYQNLSCRVWGRSAFYQSGGAYGFRDQLQDSAALVHLKPELTREQILRNAAHQFVEGDVLHWWHPPAGCGLRTAFSDDLLWLPLVACEYVLATGDDDLWRENVRFLTAPPLPKGEAEVFLQAEASEENASVYEHCCRALDRGLTRGEHGLPLIGSGDWNDGMNRIGQAGKGESVWLGFFIDYILERMLPFCERFGDLSRQERYLEYRERLRAALNEAGWDGQWYRRAYFDDGTPIGSASSDECRIDALVQAWAVLSGVAPADRAASAIAAVEKHLVDETAGLIRLLDPPFNDMANDPGYIKGYLPGIRENGGQYTHGVLWFIRAVAELGHGSRAVRWLEMLSPVNHGRTREEVDTYKGEPYVIAADVYGQPPHVGRAGWTWYTGSAGWMYRIVIESLFGIRLEAGDTMRIDPRIAADWPRCQIRYRLPDSKTQLEITIENPNGRQMGVSRASLDGQPLPIGQQGVRIPLPRDGAIHQILVQL